MTSRRRKIPVVGIGAGGHAKVMLDILALMARYRCVGLLDTNGDLWGTRVLGVPVLGNDDRLEPLRRKGVRHAFIGVGTVGPMDRRVQTYERAIKAGFRVISLIHPDSTVSKSAQWGPGLTVMAGAVINPETRLGVNDIVNTGAIIEHDCAIGDHVHVATGAHVAGGVTIGPRTFVGAGASIRHRLRLGSGSIVGMGSVVVHDVPDGVVVAGVPARILRENRP